MEAITLGRSDLPSSRLAYGCMRMLGTWNPADITPDRADMARTALLAAYEAGYTLFDHADIYCRGACEEHHGLLLRDSPDLRRQTIIATKCGVRRQGEPNTDSPGRYDFSKDWIIGSCEASLGRLGLDTIDLYQLHRPDVLMDPDEVAEAFDDLRSRGLVRWFGVSNFKPSYVALLQKSLRFPLVVNQVEISLIMLDCFEDGTLDQCLSEKMAPLAWSPVGGGMLAQKGTPRQDVASDVALLDTLDRIAIAKGSTRQNVALAWLMKHPSGIVPIVGSSDPDNIRGAVSATELELTREEWYALYIAERGAPMP